MTYDNLVTWAATKGMSEGDIADFETWGVVTYIRDLTDKQLFDQLIQGGFGPMPVDGLKDYFEDKSEEEQKAYLVYLADHRLKYPNGMNN